MARASTFLFVAAVSVALVACGEEAPPPVEEAPDEGAAALAGGESGTFGLVQMGHTAHAFAEEGRAWDGAGDDGRFTYLSAPCTVDAPVNSNATNLPTLNARLPDATSPASTRMHPLEFEVTRAVEGDGQLEGRMSLTVCQLEPGPTPQDDPVPDAEKDRIVFEWTATLHRASNEEAVFDGRFEIREGTGPYEEMTGSGTLHGYFTCAYVPDDCANLGEFTDIMLVMIGEYARPEIGP